MMVTARVRPQLRCASSSASSPSKARSSRSRASAAALLAALVAAACSGPSTSTPDLPTDAAGPATAAPEAGGPPAAPAEGVSTDAADRDDAFGPGPGGVPIRRLSNAEYQRTVRDLFPGFQLPNAAFVTDTKVAGLRNLSSSQTSTLVRIEQYETAAQTVAALVSADPDALTGCAAAEAGERECTEAYLADLGQRAYRRPLSDAERTALAELYALDQEADDPTRLSMAISALLQSPNFLFRPEIGVAEDDGPIRRLTPWELATRLSYFLAGSMPDEQLFAAAAADELSTPEQIGAQVERLLALPEAQQSLVNFHELWLGVEQVGSETKDPELYPEFGVALAASMGEETRRFLQSVLFDDPGSFRDLFTSSYTFANAELAAFYGSEPPAEEWGRIELDPTQRAGILTRASLMATLSKDNETDPVRRGKFVLEQLRCLNISPPPPAVLALFPEPDLSVTMRERFAAHRTDPVCSSCHSLLDPAGLAFEHYDASGAWRDTDRGMPLDVTGEIDGITFDGAVELSEVIANAEDTRACYVAQWFRYALGRLNATRNPEDGALIDFVSGELGPDRPLATIATTLAQSNGFRLLKVPEQ